MSVELIQKLSITAFIFAGVLFVAAVALFFLFNIPKIFGELSGSTAKKAIENIRRQNEQTGNKAYKPSTVNADRGRITDRITPSGRIEKKTGNSGISVGTEKLHTDELVVGSEETTILTAQSNETTVLDMGNQSFENTQPVNNVNNVEITVEYEIGFSGSSEVIE